MTITYKLSFDFIRDPDGDLGTFAGTVCLPMKDDPKFVTPFVPITQVEILRTNFVAAAAQCPQGGTQATAVKNACRADLIDALRRNAFHVQGASENDLPTLLGSGYEVASTIRTSVPLTTPILLTIENDGAGQLRLRLQAVLNARTYQVQLSADNGLTWKEGGLFKSTRDMIVADLKAGQTYTFQVRAIGGSTGFSDWSDPQSHMSL